MLLFGLDVPLWVPLTTVIVLLLYWYGTSTFGIFEGMGVPYSKPIPFLGNLLAILSKPLHEYELSTRDKFPGKIYGSFQGRVPTLDVADAEFIKQLTITEFANFPNRRDALEGDPFLGENLLQIKDDHWKHVRSTLTPTFTSGKLKQMHGVINECADRMVEILKGTDSAPIAVKSYTEGFTMEVIARTVFGMDIDIQGSANHPFVNHAKTFFGIPNKRSRIMQYFILICVLLLPKPVRSFLGLFMDMSFVERESGEYFRGLVDKIFSANNEQLSSRKDFVSTCSEKLVDLNTIDKESVRVTGSSVWSTKGLTKSEIAANSFIFFSAGYETTASTLHHFLYNMATHPDIQEKLYGIICDVETDDGSFSYELLNKMDYLEWCINETLRMYPPVIRVDRVASNDTTINGIDIPKGMVVKILIYLVHHDPDYWPEPEKFDPERFSPENKTEVHNYTFLGFGAGNRSCIANRLAMLELKVVIVKLLKAFSFQRTAETPDKEDVKYMKGVAIMQPATPIKIAAVPR